jgi:hypothetical protein
MYKKCEYEKTNINRSYCSTKGVEQAIIDMVNQTIECKNDDPTIHVIKNNELSIGEEDINLSCETVISRCWFFWK